jgi:hypothetical protein
MKEKENILDPLLEKAEDFGKTSLELLKLKAIDKTSDIASSALPYSLVIIFAIILGVFLNLGIAIWVGDLLGKMYLGFFAVAAFYGILGSIIYFLVYDRFKERVRNAIIQQLLK